MAPIYQPEVAAQVVLYAADHPGRKQFYVGAGAAATILANKIAPVLLDRYLARTGYDSQQTDQPDNPQRRHNLWAPADDEKDHGAHGDFDGQSSARAPQLWLSHQPAGPRSGSPRKCRYGQIASRECLVDRVCWKREELPSSQLTRHFLVSGRTIHRN
ncbi:hypothetical protein [Streptomyces sp. LN590]|uniref:hypothetical protein n=1 Tax=Streptomyces sp. LN590 TaxID=3112980 RepID=UPI00372498D7